MAEAGHRLGRWSAFAARLAFLLIMSFALTARPAAAQSILRDAETEALFADMSRPLIEAAGLRPDNVDVVLIHDRSINAFVAGGQIVYIHSGLIAAADNANEVQGVIAHEIGHITGGHIIRMQEGVKTATGIMILSMILGAAAMAAGAGEAGMGVLAAGQQAAMGKFLAFSRTQESAADAAAAGFFARSETNGKGLLTFFKKLQNQEFRYAIPQDNAYARTHPLTGERLAALEQSVKEAPGWNRATDPKLEARFQRVKAKLMGFVEEPERTLVAYPESNKSVPARYARAYAWHKRAYPEKALAEADSLLADEPNDPYFLELKGQILLESGRPAAALESLRQAVRYAPDQPLDRRPARPRPHLDREARPFRGGQAGAAGGDRPRQFQPLRLVPARHRLRPRGRYRPGGARHRRALQSAGRAAAGPGQCRAGAEDRPHRLARLAPGAGHRHGVAHRGGTEEKES